MQSSKMGGLPGDNSMKYLIAIGVVILLCCLAFGQQAAKYGGTIKIGLLADIATLYPWKMTDVETFSVMQGAYEPLIRLKKASADIEPCLAVKWIPSSDYLMWTFNLRKNVKFHDGTPFTADSVIETFAQHTVFPGKIKKIDDYTIVFNLDKPDAAFALSLSVENYGIVGTQAIKCFKEKCAKPPVIGTGPFIFERWIPGKEIAFRANENYWGGKPYLNQVIFIPFPNNTELMQALKNQTIHLTSAILPDNITAIRDIPYLIFQARPALSLGYVGMNSQKPPFNNSKVRIAISYAINRKEWVAKYFLNGQAGIIAKSCLPPTMFGYNKDLPEREYNPAKAKALLKEAGFPDGFETTLLLPYSARLYLPYPVQMGEDVKNNLAAIGIRVRILPIPGREEFRKATTEGKFDMLLFGWVADTIDPNDFLTALLSTQSIGTTNRVRWSNDYFDRFLQNARSENISARVETYKKAQEVFYKEMPLVPLVNALQLSAWNQKVKGYTLHTTSRLYLHDVWLSE